MAEKEEGFNWTKIGQYGLIAGICIIYVCLVGMVETFHERDVIEGYVSLGRSLIVVTAIGMGYFAALKMSEGNAGKALISGAVTGVVGGIVTAIMVLLIEPWGLREMFVNASPALIEILTFAQESMATGLIWMIGAITILSVFGAALYILPALIRRAVFVGLSAVLIIGMLQELLEVILSRSDTTEPISDFLFGKTGLSITGTLVIFVVFSLLNAFWSTQGDTVKTGVSNLPDTQRKALNWTFIAIGFVFVITLPQLVGPYISQILVLVGLFILMGLGLNIEIGLAGLLDLGFVGFYAIGAYMVALATTPTEIGLGGGESLISFWIVIPFAVIVSSLSGIFLGIPVLRMRGDYLAIVTLGLAEIIRILVLSDFLRPILGGAQGILSIPKPSLSILTNIVGALPAPIQNLYAFFLGDSGVVKDPGHFYYLIVIGCVVIAFIAGRLQNARIGRSWMAMREDEDVAEAMGINLVASKLLAFGIGAGFAGLSGAIFAAQVGSVFPHSFALLVSVNVVSLVIIGGVGSIPGVIVGALVLVGLPELLREFAEFRLLIYGALLVVMMLVKPEGLWPSEVTRREFREDDEEIEAIPAPASR
ncbi:MAG: hypothetical protein AAF485_02215 [Chloroflexota bacterium]